MLLQRWVERFEAVLNRPSATNEETIGRMQQVDTNYSLDTPSEVAEVKKATNQLSSGKAPGESYKTGGPPMTEKLTELFQSFWTEGAILQELKDASIVHLYKRKGNRQACDNHRGISLLSIAGKILARVLLNRLINHQEQGQLPESQCGFRKRRGTIDMIFAARQLQEKCQEHKSAVHNIRRPHEGL